LVIEEAAPTGPVTTMNAQNVHLPDRDAGPTDEATCDHCHLQLDPSEPRTMVGTAIYHRRPNCYLRKLHAIRH
jgi:hypothetical protein